MTNEKLEKLTGVKVTTMATVSELKAKRLKDNDIYVTMPYSELDMTEIRLIFDSDRKSLWKEFFLKSSISIIVSLLTTLIYLALSK